MPATNPVFVARLAPYLRNELKIRSASIVLAAEYVAGRAHDHRLALSEGPGRLLKVDLEATD